MSKVTSMNTVIEKFGKNNPPNKIIEQLVLGGLELHYDAPAQILRITQGNHVVTNASFENLQEMCQQHKINGKIKESKEINYCTNLQEIIQKELRAERFSDNVVNSTTTIVSDFASPTTSTMSKPGSFRVVNFLKDQLNNDKDNKLYAKCKNQSLIERYAGIDYTIFTPTLVEAFMALVNHYNDKIKLLVMLAVDVDNPSHQNAQQQAKDNGSKLLRLLRMTTEQSQISAIAKNQSLTFLLSLGDAANGTEFVSKAAKHDERITKDIQQREMSRGSLSAEQLASGNVLYQMRKELASDPRYAATVQTHCNEYDLYEKGASAVLINLITTIDDMASDTNPPSNSSSSASSKSMAAIGQQHEIDDDDPFPDKVAAAKVHQGLGVGKLWEDRTRGGNYDDQISKYFDMKDYLFHLKGHNCTAEAREWATRHNYFDKHDRAHGSQRSDGNNDNGGSYKRKNNRNNRGNGSETKTFKKQIKALTARVEELTESNTRSGRDREKDSRRDHRERSRSRSRDHRERSSSPRVRKSMLSFNNSDHNASSEEDEDEDEASASSAQPRSSRSSGRRSSGRRRHRR